ncbi:PREDICTED: uncharacterized protein LOC108548340 [Eufriesea mexicana]|uniref:uncharacterized protein LOC108548340 n=1 Tax=Eufriesea mexicana TaxID=516756 RepID=UPI00083C273F|nr:PREDICTED: uncharacterized protein LOC108548340 [Eufriesea mexicana]
MFENVPSDEKYGHDKEDIMEELEHKPLLVSIPKIEPLFPNISISNEDTSNVDELAIPFVTPYKVKDPIILLERCDKIWETLKIVKNIQDRNKSNVFNSLPLEVTAAKSTNVLNDNKYIEYQPVLGNNSAGLPNFKLSVKNKKKLYQCVTCGKQYSLYRTMRYHSQKIHGIYIPTKTMKNDEKKMLDKEMMINEKINSLYDNIPLLTCTLCKQSIRDMRKHLVDYHKIESPNFMLKKLDEKLTVSEGNKLNVFNNENKTLNEISQEKQRNSLYFQNVRRRKSNILRNKKRKCEICLGLYQVSSFFRHIRVHRTRGETKENFHLSTKKYANSPLHRKSKKNFKIDDIFFPSTKYNAKYNSNLSKNNEGEEQIMQNENKDKKMSDVFVCSCGRSFRNPHTLFTHKKYCILSKELELLQTADSVAQSDSDRHSGTGLSITIKKKNNSYEIIDKDNGNTSENNTQIELQDYPREILELSKYSERHSILKLESVNEDVDIDIEDDSEANFSNNNISNSACEVVNNFSQEREESTIKVEQDDKSYQENSNSELLQETALSKNDSKQSNDIKVNFKTKYNVCLCGYQFYTKRALEIHISKHHAGSKLLCGYCKANFPNATEWNKHLCSVTQGKKFVPLPLEINCRYCNITLNAYKKFDDHVKLKHFDPILPFHCFQCHKRFSNTTARKMHADTDHKITICSICNNKCLNFMKSKHKAYHYGLGFPCHFCKRTYTCKIHLLRHNKAVHHNILESSIYDLNQLSFMNSTISDLGNNS